MIVVYDLRDPDAWRRAHADLEAWGRSYAEWHELDEDHVLLVFKAGGGTDLEAAA